jgi:uncharacterized protein DUF669
VIDGLYRVSTPYLCAGFVVERGTIVQCAPILRGRIEYWITVAQQITGVNMANIGSFNPLTTEPGKPFEPVPTGWYNVQIVESDTKPTKLGTGHYLELVLEIIDGQYHGRKVWDRLNLDNPNAMAKEIAYRTLSAICHATNVLHQISDSAELHGKPLMARVVKRAATDEYDESNDVKGYKKLEAASAGVPSAPWATPASAPLQPMAPPATVSPAPQYPPEAIAWARSNAADPRAQQILASLGPPAPPAWQPPPTPPAPPPPTWTPPAAPAGVQPPAVSAAPWQTPGNGAPAAPAMPPPTGWTPPAPPPAAGAASGAKPPWEK